MVEINFSLERREEEQKIVREEISPDLKVSQGWCLAGRDPCQESDWPWSALLLGLFWLYYNQLVPTCVI